MKIIRPHPSTWHGRLTFVCISVQATRASLKVESLLPQTARVERKPKKSRRDPTSRKAPRYLRTQANGKTACDTELDLDEEEEENEKFVSPLPFPQLSEKGERTGIFIL